jgi:hypothetical protein
MTPPKRSSRKKPPRQPPEENGVVQLKVWLLGISPIVWRRLLVPSTCTLRELHGVIQVAVGWEGIHLYQFCLRAAHYGSSELWISSPEVTLAALRLRKGARFIYEYDLSIPRRHEVRIEDHLPAEPGETYPPCTGGGGACPPEDCGGPEGYLAGLDEAVSVEAFEDWDTLIEILDQVVREERTELLKDEEARWRLEQALERIEDRELTPRAAAWMMLRRAERRSAEGRELLADLRRSDPELDEAIARAEAFIDLVRDRAPDRLDSWLNQAVRSTLRPLRSFTKHLSADDDAVRAAVTLGWSNGPVEGQINRLKTLKRQMYGRAGLDLLGRRFLLAA